MKKREKKEILQIKIGKDIDYTKQCIHQLENTLKDANDDLAKVLRGNFKREDVVKSHIIIQMSLGRRRVLESTLEDLEAKKRKLLSFKISLKVQSCKLCNRNKFCIHIFYSFLSY